MDDIVLARTLRSQGYDERALARMRRDSDLIPVRRGAYARERAAERTCAEAHRELILERPLHRPGRLLLEGTANHRGIRWEDQVRETA